MAATFSQTSSNVPDSRRSLLKIRKPCNPISGSLLCCGASMQSPSSYFPFKEEAVRDMARSCVLRSCMRALPRCPKATLNPQGKACHGSKNAG